MEQGKKLILSVDPYPETRHTWPHEHIACHSYSQSPSQTQTSITFSVAGISTRVQNKFSNPATVLGFFVCKQAPSAVV